MGGIMKAFPNKNTIIKYAGKFGPIHEKEEIQNGMDLRDYFAAKAMQADITNYEDNSKFGPDFWSTENIAKRAYNMADAMMEARKK